MPEWEKAPLTKPKWQDAPLVDGERPSAQSVLAGLAPKVGRQVALTGRALAEGGIDLFSPFADALGAAANLGLRAAGSDYRFPRTSENFSGTLTMLGVPEPETMSEKISNFGGRLATGVAAGRTVDRLVMRGLGLEAPEAAATQTVGQLRQTAGRAYDAASDAGVRVEGGRFANVVDDIVKVARQEGIDPDLHPAATAALKRLTGAVGDDVDFGTIETLRKIVKDAAGSNSRAERRIAKILANKLDEFVDGMSQADVVAGDAETASQAIRLARDTWSRMRKGELMDEIMELAQDKAGQYTQSGIGNAIRTKFRQLARNQKQMRMFLPEEREAIRRIARGGNIENVFRWLGKAAPRGIISGALGPALGASVGGPVGAVAVPLAGEVGRRTSDQMARSSAERLNELVRRGLPLPTRRVPGAAEMEGAGIVSGNALNWLYDRENDLNRGGR